MERKPFSKDILVVLDYLNLISKNLKIYTNYNFNDTYKNITFKDSSEIKSIILYEKLIQEGKTIYFINDKIGKDLHTFKELRDVIVIIESNNIFWFNKMVNIKFIKY